jgi:ATP-dependent helicase YprA (DUF1998 family)
MAQSNPSDTSWQLAQTLQIGAAIRALRGRRSATWLSDATAAIGERVGRSTITDIEIGRRKYVAVHELSLVAAALGVSRLYPWQAAALALPGVLRGGRSLVYSAPTAGGKTLVATILELTVAVTPGST